MSEHVHSERERRYAVAVTMLDKSDPGLSFNNEEWHRARQADAHHLKLLAATGRCFDDDDAEGTL